MILTGNRIREEVKRQRIIIDPYDDRRIEPNSYGFSLSDKFIIYRDWNPINMKYPPDCETFIIPRQGYTLHPNHLYLSNTYEILGSCHYAKTLYARCSTATMGMWIQFSAPLGHTGAIIPWTLEILVSHPIIIYPFMLIGKIAFWENFGEIINYNGKYNSSETVMASKMYQDNFAMIPNNPKNQDIFPV